MYQYRIALQFASPDGPAFDGILEEIGRSAENYNAKSLIARNPKRIVDYKVTDAGKTLEVTIQSENELAYPGKALRLFSEYLATNPGSLKQHLYNDRQLFKMMVIGSDPARFASEPGERATLTEDVLLLKRLLDLILADDRETLAKARELLMGSGEGERP